MDDCCAVCAEPLEWVAYGSCGHREVCSTCVVRLRFILSDPRCCICKSPSPAVFVTKAMGDYTRVLSDFSVLSPGAAEGPVGQYWYHEDSQAYFDDADHYRMIKAMCRLSCGACDAEGEDQRRTRFRNIHQLKGHLFHKHKLFMCSLCLEGRKVFMCEQKLYTRSQLNQHISTGDSEVDGNENERGGFSGHPMCQFCKSPFYGDNELYMHMSRDHYTCHICQRRNPGQYDYFRNYDDLEVHFRHEHFICEDDACLAEKFVVFQSEAELKRHNAMKHGGNMSRSKRNAALVLPTSFRFRGSGQERRGRGYRLYADSPDAFSFGTQSTSQTSSSNSRHIESSSGPTISQREDARQIDYVRGSFESLNVTSDLGPQPRSETSDRGTTAILLEEAGFPALSEREVPEPSFRFAQTLNFSNARSNLGEASFPPLPGASTNNPPEPKSSGKSFASRVGKKHPQSKSVSKASQWSTVNHGETSTLSSSSQTWPSVQNSLSTSKNPVPSLAGVATPSSSVASQVKSSVSERISSPSSSGKTNRLNHSSSAPDLVSSGKSPQITGDVHAANKSLVEKIRATPGMDEDRFSAFKCISAEYRQGLIGAAEYVAYVHQFGLAHLVVDLAQLCPDPKKQKELIDIYKANLQYKPPTENGSIASSSKESKMPSKQKGKSVHVPENTSATAKLTDGILNTVRRLQENYRPKDEDIELLSKDGYRNTKGRSISAPGRESTDPDSSALEQKLNDIASSQDPGGVNGKQRKKTSKFHRVRLGDGSAAALFELTERNTSPEHPKGSSSSHPDNPQVRGAWKSGGGQRLFGTSSKVPPR